MLDALSARHVCWVWGLPRQDRQGLQADVVLLDHVNFVPLNNATNQIVFTENGDAVDKVLIGGKLVVAGGRAIGIDRAALAAKAQAAVERLAALNADARRFAERIEPILSSFVAANHHAGRACRTTRKSLVTDSPVQPGWATVRRVASMSALPLSIFARRASAMM
jgi:hypothetical protein